MPVIPARPPYTSPNLGLQLPGGSGAPDYITATRAIIDRLEQLLPVGVPVPWLTSAIPDGYIEFAGQTITSGQYPRLFALFGATLPDLRGRTLMGYDATYPIGTTGGAAAHTLTPGEVATRSHYHGTAGGQGVITADAPAGKWLYGSPPDGTEWVPYSVFGNPATGGAQAPPTDPPLSTVTPHNNLPPYRTVRWITVAA